MILYLVPKPSLQRSEAKNNFKAMKFRFRGVTSASMLHIDQRFYRELESRPLSKQNPP